MTTSPSITASVATVATPAVPTQPVSTAVVSTKKTPTTTKDKLPKVASELVTQKTPALKKGVPVKAVKKADTVAAKDLRAKKPKLVRDSFTIPKDEYAVVETLKQRASTLAQPVKKSELLRAGLKVLATLSDNALRTALQAVPSIKTGRPKTNTEEVVKTVTKKVASKSTRK